eukprot:CAMPEP_0194601556 /NCGR_PEP_ID=MMETSP0292-20121207/29086_1 /TAXON_ID=39354 /ORGANISM="Heterosigma akashiwo, Strain CCMP2393" /LENGTH=130 /DNA_ID=CAMNT_0039463553 /DNA_START=167 /DNA_END=555 /DNA_ORIENTATION=-
MGTDDKETPKGNGPSSPPETAATSQRDNRPASEQKDVEAYLKQVLEQLEKFDEALKLAQEREDQDGKKDSSAVDSAPQASLRRGEQVNQESETEGSSAATSEPKRRGRKRKSSHSPIKALAPPLPGEPKP